jgi:hypothetical protein
VLTLARTGQTVTDNPTIPGAQLLVENNVWTGTDKPLYSTDAGFAVATGNDFGGAANTGKFSLFGRGFFFFN